MGAGERAFFVAEQFAFQERFRNGAAIDGDERAVSSGASLMNGPRRHFLAGAAFAQKQHGRVGGGHFADGFKDRLHGRAGAQHAFEGVALQQLLHLAVFQFQLGDVEAAPQEKFQFLHFHRLAQKIVGAGPDGAQRDLLFALAGDDDNLGQPSMASRSDKVAKPSSGLPGWGGRPKSSNTTVGLCRLKGFDGAGAVFGEQNFVVLRQRPLHLGANFLVVVNYQQFGVHLVCFGSRQNDPKGRAFAQLAFDLDSASVRLDNHLALKHADAKPIFLGGLKGAEQGAAQKFRVHAAAVVGHGQNRPAVALAGFDADFAGRQHGFPGVEHQVGHHFEHLLLVQQNFGQWTQGL